MTKATNQNKHIIQVMEDTFQMVPEIAIPDEELFKVSIHNLATGVCNTCTEMARVQLELNL